jgi:Zn-dependent peptidase ImmA (M78 family)
MSGGQGFRSPEMLFRQLRITRPEHIDLEVIAYACEALVRYEPLTGCEAYLIGNHDRAIIAVNEASPMQRQRFSIGHEIGHWMRDRGTVSFSCDQRKMSPRWRQDNPERLANLYAADLLMPESMFRPRAQRREITLATVRALAHEFRTSLSATAIRLVEMGSFPAMAIYTTTEGRQWAASGRDLPDALKLRDQMGMNTVASEILGESGEREGARSVYADNWFLNDEADRFSVHEESVRAGGGVLSLLWWKDEGLLLALEREDE